MLEETRDHVQGGEVVRGYCAVRVCDLIRQRRLADGREAAETGGRIPALLDGIARSSASPFEAPRLLLVLEPSQLRLQPADVMLCRLVVRRLLDLVLGRFDLLFDRHSMTNRVDLTSKNFSTQVRDVLPYGSNALRFQTLHRVQHRPSGPRGVRRQVETSKHPMEGQSHGVEHLLQFCQGVGPHGRGEFPRSLAVQDHLPGLEPPPQQVERGVLEDDGSVVPSLPGLVRQARDQAVPVEHLHQEFSARMECTGNPLEDLAVFLRTVEIAERREHADRGVERVREPEASHVALDERRFHPGETRGLAGLREKRPREIEARHAVPALRQPDRVAAGPARDVQDPAPLPQMEDLVDRLDLGVRLRVDIADEVIRSKKILKPSFRDLRHRRAANAICGENFSAYLRTRRVPAFPATAATRGARSVITTWSPPCSRQSTPASIFGPMPPGGNCPAARSFFATAPVSPSRNRWEGFPKSSATWGTSVAITRCVHPIARARAAAARSLSITASTPTSFPFRRTTGMPPPPAAMTSRPSPSATSRRISSASTTSTGRGDGTTRRQPPRWSYTIFQPFAFFTTISSSRA